MCDVCGNTGDFTTPPSTPERVAEVEDRMRATILEHGHQILGIFGNADSPPFFYTVGRGLFDKPELLLTGPLPNKIAMSVLNHACDMIDDGSLVLSETGVTEVPPDTLLTGVPCRIVPVPDPAGAEMTRAVSMTPNLKAYQVVWPDMEGNFPGEANYDTRFEQPVHA